MARNIPIFSDGTGQVGGYDFDEDRTNVYKLFRATRIGSRNRALIPRSRLPFTTRVSALAVRAAFHSDAWCAGYIERSAKPLA